MNQEQIEKQIEWLEKERRGDKQTIAALEKRIAEMEENLERSTAQAQQLDSEITKLGVTVTRIEAFDDALDAHRKEVKKELSAIEKRIKGREKYAKQKQEGESSTVNRALAEHEEKFKEIPTLRDQIKVVRSDGENNAREITKLPLQIAENKDAYLDLAQSVKLLEEDLAASKQRFPDLQGEIAAQRKRLDEQHAKHDLLEESHKKTDTRVNEVLVSEESRRNAQVAFTEKITLENMEMEKSFKEWTNRFDVIEAQAAELPVALQGYREIEHNLLKAQKDFEDITEQISRRIHEITEMQRLGEERFRQEWTTFKADDQKRWVNFTLTHEEQTKEANRRTERLSDRTTTQEELLQDLQDTVQHTGEQLESLIQNLMGIFREWMTTNERFTESL